MENIIVIEKNLIDLSAGETPDKMLSDLNNALEQNDFRNKVFKVNLGDIPFTLEQITSLKTAIEGSGAIIDLIITKSINTQLASLEAGLVVSEKSPKKEYKQNPEKIYELVQVDQLEAELKESLESLSDSETIFEESNEFDHYEEDNSEKVLEEFLKDEENTNTELVNSIKENKNDSETMLKESSEFDQCEEENSEKALEKFLKDEENANTEPVNSIKKENKNDSEKTLYIKQTLRSGRTINFDGSIVIIGDCKPGSEIIATGDINVWGELSGIAHAGSKGDTSASIRALKINAIQLRIANMFSRKPDRLLSRIIQKKSSFTPEEAKIQNGEIKIFSYNY